MSNNGRVQAVVRRSMARASAGVATRPAMPGDEFRRHGHELGIAPGEPILGGSDIVLETRPHVPAELDGPIGHFDLMPSDAGCRPGGVRQDRQGFVDHHLQQPLDRRPWRFLTPSTNCRCACRSMRPSSTSRFAPWICERSNTSISGLTGEELHLVGKLVHQRRLVLVDDRREVDRARRKRTPCRAGTPGRPSAGPGYGRGLPVEN